MPQLEEGMPAPHFSATGHDGKMIRLADFRGKKVVLYFYPQDDTEACTKEACNLRDNYNELINKGFEVLGVSPDSENSHVDFRKKYSLPFTLISDPERKLLNLYGVYGQKILYGKEVTGVIRTTFIIDENGIIEKIIRKVKTAAHTEQIFKLYEK
jgi:peroxiredoxin Q/BCP